jgi:RNA polymerase sigma-70 factor (ECF subfamily)
MAPAGESSCGGSLRSSFLLRLRGRQPEAWQALLRLYGPLVYSWCRSRWGLDPEEAADVLQDVMLRVVEALGDFRGGNFVAWLRTITRSRVADRFRRGEFRGAGGSQALQQLAELEDPRAEADEDEFPNGELDYTGLGGVLGRAIGRIREKTAPATWAAFWQVTVEGRTADDVAADLGLTRNAVYIANSRVLRRLRDELGRLSE